MRLLTGSSIVLPLLIGCSSMLPGAPGSDGGSPDSGGAPDSGLPSDAGMDGGACPLGESLCDGGCANLLADEANCGACGNVCAPDQICQSRRAGAACMCDTSKPDAGDLVLCDGGCIHTQSDAQNCGICGLVCDAGTCAGGACVVTDAGPDAGGCLAVGAPCVLQTDCCSTNCVGDAVTGAFCAPPPDSGSNCGGALGALCFGDLDCCSQFCSGWDAPSGGSCADPATSGCLALGAGCSPSSACCSGACGPGDGGEVCVVSGGCRHETYGCFESSECCTGLCAPGDGGRCLPGAYCRRLDATCTQQSDCCSGWCSTDGGVAGVCYLPRGDGGPLCIDDTLPCSQDSDCCTGYCLGRTPQLTIGYCARQSGATCSANAVACIQPGECCTGICGGGADGGGSTCMPAATCQADYASCSRGADCCSGFCDPDFATCLPLCTYGRGGGADCTVNSDCCSYSCSGNGDAGTIGGTCQLLCTLNGQSCYSDEQCCGLVCSVGLLHSTYTCITSLADAGERCRWDTQDCSQNGDCCSGTCFVDDGGDAGQCTEFVYNGDAGSTGPCLPENALWDGGSAGCCSSATQVLPDGGLLCVFEVCLPENALCYGNGDCCSGYCQGWDAGGGTCLSQGLATCTLAGGNCLQDSDCCTDVCVQPPDAGPTSGDDAGQSDAGQAPSASCSGAGLCLSDGNACYQNSDCCGGFCASSDGGLVCQTPDGG